ncbi:MAG: TonB-dependent receptor plug domain-containing protein [Bacteroidales bacterium]|nr:TonB-dependent receptor plug domain-containing protein [Bacteroidales bacterium]
MKFFLTLILLTLFFCISAQNNFSLVDFQVTDNETGLSLPNVQVKVVEVSKVFNSSELGQVKMALPNGTYRFAITHDDYQSSIKTFVILNDTTISIALKSFEKSVLIEEVNVMENRIFKYNTLETGTELLSSKTILSLPVMAGEKDLVKSLSLLPGMQTTGEGSANLVVRGGNPDQNLFLINGVPMYQTNHFFSMVSTINPLLVDHVKVYKSGFPANYGGRISSIIDIETKTPHMDSIHLDGDVGLISSKLVASIPIIKNKLVIMGSLRRTYLDLVARPFVSDLGNVTFNFTDASFQANWKITPFNEIQFFNYYSRDNFMDIYKQKSGIEEISNLNRYDNLLAGFEWEVKKEKFENNLTIGCSTYGKDISKEIIKDTSYTENSHFITKLENILLTNNLSYKISEVAYILAGFQVERIRLKPAEMRFENVLEQYNQTRINELLMLNGAVWGTVNYSFKKLRASFGFRENIYHTNQTTYPIFEPRINLLYELSSSSSIKSSYSKSSQPLHLLSNNGLGRPVDLWLGADSIRMPMVASQWSVGYYNAFKLDKLDYEFSCEAYVKTTDHLISYRDGFSSSNFTRTNYLESTLFINEILTYGKGIAYGLEVLIEKKEGALTGWLSYTLSKSKNQFAEFENGSWFNSTFDRPHNFVVAGNYCLPNNWELNLSFNVMSGQPFTLPIALYTQSKFDMLSSKALVYNVQPIYINSERNSIRLKTFHKLDIGFKKQLKSRKKFSHWIEFSIYNVYNRKNSTYGYVRDYSGTNEIKVISVSLFPIIPSISYSFSF